MKQIGHTSIHSIQFWVIQVFNDRSLVDIDMPNSIVLPNINIARTLLQVSSLFKSKHELTSLLYNTRSRETKIPTSLLIYHNYGTISTCSLYISLDWYLHLKLGQFASPQTTSLFILFRYTCFRNKGEEQIWLIYLPLTK